MSQHRYLGPSSLEKAQNKRLWQFYVHCGWADARRRTLSVKALELSRVGKCLQGFSLLPHKEIFAEVPEDDAGPWSHVQRPWNAVSWAREIISKTE